MCALIPIIEGGIGAARFDDENCLAKAQRLVELGARQLGKIAPLEACPIANLHAALPRIRSIVAGLDPAAMEAPMEPRDYGPFPYVPINQRPKLEWPGGARLAVWIVPNIEFFPLSIGIPGSPYDTRVPAAPTVRAWAQRDYGNPVRL